MPVLLYLIFVRFWLLNELIRQVRVEHENLGSDQDRADDDARSVGHVTNVDPQKLRVNDFRILHLIKKKIVKII